MLHRLEQLRASAQAKMAPRQVHGLLEHVSTLVGGLVEERVVDVRGALQNKVLEPVMARFAFFPRFAKAYGKVVTGAGALQHAFELARTQFAGGKLGADDVKMLRIYHWLVPAELQEEVKTMLEHIKTLAASTKHIENVIAAPKKAAKAGKTKIDPAVTAAMKMFS